MSLSDLLKQFAGGKVDDPADHLQRVAEHAPPDVLGQGLAEAFRSDKTPAFGDMVGQLFGHSNGTQRAGMLNALVSAVGPAVLAGLASGALGKALRPGSPITADQAAKLTPEQVQQLATHAEQQSPGVVDHLSNFYAEHPTLVKTLGGVAAAIALTKIQNRFTDRT